MTEVSRPLFSWKPASVAIVAGVWTALVVLSIVSGILTSREFGQSVEPWREIVFRSADWYSCAVFTPLFVWMARRWPLQRHGWWRRVPIWLAITAAAVPLKFLLTHLGLIAFGTVGRRSLRDSVIVGFIPETIAFWAMIGVILAVEYHDRWREREFHAQRLGRQLDEARMEALSAQLRPHFLFNTLQGISTLLHRDPRGADRMLSRLSELLRRTLRRADHPEVPLSEELETLSHYVAIQQIRFEDRLDVQVHAEGVGNVLVPHFVLQPLVENAIEHGTARSADRGRVTISVTERDGRLTLDVRDDGAAGSVPVPRPVRGIGLSNTRSRLAALYGDAATLDSRSIPNGGHAVTIVIPSRRASEPR